jgi:23S rRNA pseudouridine1911/1915/1917 synthase
MILIESHIVENLEEQQRISDYLPGKLIHITSKKGIKKALIDGKFTLNGRIAKTADYVKGGETIAYLKSQHAPKKKLLYLDLEVPYQDDDLGIVVKPAGIAVSGNMKRVVENALPKNLKKTSKKDALDWPMPVHRLDFPTSGLLLCAKTKSAQIGLNQLFENRAINKTYYAITIGKMKKSGTIESEIKGKKAITIYEVIETEASEKYGQLNLVKLNPLTGRRHQLRIHMLELGNPILGDQEYKIEGKVLQGKGLYLVATGMAFTHPITNEEIDINIALPGKFKKIFGKDKA